MALSLNNVLGRRTLALVGVGAATALTSWLIYLRNRYLNLKQITGSKESDGKSKKHQNANQSTDSSGGGSSGGVNQQTDSPQKADNSADLQMESLSADTSVRQADADGPVRRRHVTPIVEEDSAAGAAAASAAPGEVSIDDSSPDQRVLTARSAAYKSANSSSAVTAAAPAAGTAVLASETEILDSDFEQEIRAAKADTSAAAASPPNETAAAADSPDLTSEFIANRLAAMSKSDSASVQLLDRDADVLARCLVSGSDGDTVRTMQLVGQLAQFQHHMDRLSRGGGLVAAICDVFRRSGRASDSASVDVRLQCLLNLINLSGVPSNQQAIVELAGSVASAVSTSPRLAQYALQLLANLALYQSCRPRLLPLLPGFLAELRLQLLDSASPPANAEQQRRLRQCLTLLGNLTSDSSACQSALATEMDSTQSELPVPAGAAQLLAFDPAVRLAWVCFVGNLARETDTLRAANCGGATLADGFMASLPAMSKLAQKLRDKLRSADKATEYGQKVAALSKDLKSLLRQSKVKSK